MPIQLKDGSGPKKRQNSAFKKQIDNYNNPTSSSGQTSPSDANFSSATQGAISVDAQGNEQNYSPANANYSKASGGAGYAAPPLDPQYERAVRQIYEPNGWKKLSNAGTELYTSGLSALNKVREFNGRPPIGVPASFENSFSPLDVLPGTGVVGKAVIQQGGKQAAKKYTGKIIAKTSADRIAFNTATEKATASYLTKLVKGMKDPYKLGGKLTSAVVGGIIGAIGTYPFASWAKQEALQSVEWGTRTALENGDLDGAREALELRREVLDPNLWERIAESIPFVNVVDNLAEYFEAAQIKLRIDERIVADMSASMELVSTEQGAQGVNSDGSPRNNSTTNNRDAYFAFIREEEAREERAIIDYYNEERMTLLDWESNARAAQREEEARFWAEQRALKSRAEAADREAQAEFWFQYRKRLQELTDNNRPSKLNFGLL